MTSDNMTYVNMSPVDILSFDQYEHFSVVRALVPWYDKREALGWIPGWGSQITFRSRQRFGLI